MRSVRLVVLGLVAAGVLGLFGVAAAQRTSMAFTIGVVPGAPVAPLKAGQEVCQRPLDVPGDASFDRVALQVGTYERTGSPLRVTVLDEGGRTVAEGRLAGGYPDVAAQPTKRVALDRTVDAPSRISVCVANEGTRRVAIYGGGDAAARTSTAVIAGRPIGADVTMVFERESRSMLALVPDMLARAALFRIPGMGGWAYAVLAVLLLAVPWLLIRAVSAAAADRAADGGDARP